MIQCPFSKCSATSFSVISVRFCLISSRLALLFFGINSCGALMVLGELFDVKPSCESCADIFMLLDGTGVFMLLDGTNVNSKPIVRTNSPIGIANRLCSVDTSIIPPNLVTKPNKIKNNPPKIRMVGIGVFCIAAITVSTIIFPCMSKTDGGVDWRHSDNLQNTLM